MMREITCERRIVTLTFRGERPVVFGVDFLEDGLLFHNCSVSVNAEPDMISPSYFNDLFRF